MSFRHLFGPVPSRRLGVSLGVDLIPFKVCSLNCTYCECGETTELTVERREHVSFDSIAEELNEYFSREHKLDYVTFGGSGEPTLNSRLGELISLVRSLTDTPVAVLTNGTLMGDPDVRSELMDADLVLPSLDAAEVSAFKRVNRPHPSLDIRSIVDGLTEFTAEFSGKVWLEVFMLPGYNDDRVNLIGLKKSLRQIRPDRIQLNTLDRPGAVPGLRAASREELERLASHWDLPGLEIIASAVCRKEKASFSQDVESAIMETIRRRPCTLQDLEAVLGIHRNEINKYLSTLEGAGRIETLSQERGVFYIPATRPTGAK